jgi:transposase
MQGKKNPEQKLFYTINLEDLVPKDHPVRLLSEVLDLNFLHQITKKYYSHEGKPSIDPVVIFKIYLLGYFFGISSERKLFRELQVNMAYRWYIGYDLDEEVPDHSILSKARQRFPEHVFATLFKRIVNLCKDAGLISGKYLFLDSSLVHADASRDSYKTKLRLAEEYLHEIAQEGRGARGFDGNVDPEKMGRRRYFPKKSDFIRSKTDPDAFLASRPGKGAFPAYKAHISVDRKRKVILSVKGTYSNWDDMTGVHDLYTHALFSLKKKPAYLVADSKYGGIEALKYFQDKNIRTCIPIRYSNHPHTKYKNTKFILSEDRNYMTCPAGKKSTRKSISGYRKNYQWNKETCMNCSLRNKCTDSQTGRLVSFYEHDYFTAAEEIVRSFEGQKLMRARKICVEGVFGEAKEFHLLRRCQYRGIGKFKIQLYLSSSVINLKRLIIESKKRVEANTETLKVFFHCLFSYELQTVCNV